MINPSPSQTPLQSMPRWNRRMPVNGMTSFRSMPASLLNAFGILVFAWAWLSYDHNRPGLSFHAESLALLGIGLLAASRGVVPGPQRDKGGLIVPRLAWGVGLFGTLRWVGWVGGVCCHRFPVAVRAGRCGCTGLCLCARRSRCAAEPGPGFSCHRFCGPGFCGHWPAAMAEPARTAGNICGADRCRGPRDGQYGPAQSTGQPAADGYCGAGLDL